MGPENEQLREVVAGVVSEDWGGADIHLRVEDAARRGSDQWARLVDDLGIVALHAPEEAGGAGMGLTASATIVAEAARQVAPAPLLTGLGIAPTLATAGTCLDPTATREVVSGRVRTTALTAVAEDVDVSEASLTGTLPPVLDLPGARRVLIPVRAADGIDLWRVELPAAGVEAASVETLDPTRPQATLDLRDAMGTRLARLSTADWAGARARVALLVAAELIAIARHVAEISIEHARTREQFDRRIGSFQAVKHTLVDMHLAIERADAAMASALRAADSSEDQHDLPAAASTALAMAIEAAVDGTAEAIHVHGGIGFTWEHELHWCYRRARSSATILGTAREHRATVATALGF